MVIFQLKVDLVWPSKVFAACQISPRWLRGTRSAAAPWTNRRKPSFNSGAPPVISRTCHRWHPENRHLGRWEVKKHWDFWLLLLLLPKSCVLELQLYSNVGLFWRLFWWFSCMSYIINIRDLSNWFKFQFNCKDEWGRYNHFGKMPNCKRLK